MKKTLLTKVAIFTIILSFNLSLFTFVFAQSCDKYENTVIVPQNIAITKGYNNITLGALGKLNCQGETQVLYGYLAGITMELQELKNKEWTTIKTWSQTDADYVALSTSYFVLKGTYRLRLTHKAYDSNMKQVESFVKYSKTIYYE